MLSPLTMLRRRLLGAIATILAISALVFALVHLIPGDPIDVLLGERASAGDRDGLRHALGLDVSLAHQFLAYYGRLAHFDFGVSLHSQQPIGALLRARIPYTLALSATAFTFALVLAVPLGIAAALRPGHWPDQIGAGLALCGGAMPGFVIGPLLIAVFAVALGWCPIGGAESARSVILPATTLALGLAAVLARQLRAALLNVLDEPYLQAAAARGLDFPTRLRRHALRNAAIPVLTVLGMQLGALLGGTVITETVFAWPGLGTLTMEAIERRDYPLLQACVLVISTVYVVINALTDVVCAWCDPRRAGST